MEKVRWHNVVAWGMIIAITIMIWDIIFSLIFEG